MTTKPSRRHVLPRRDAFFGLHFDLHPKQTDTELGAATTAENVAELLERVRPDYVQYDCKGHAGWAGYRTKVGWPSPGIVNDALAIWRDVTSRHGVGLYIHYSGVWDTKAVTEHPEWARIGPDGAPDGRMTSTFGPYVDELMIPQLAEAVSAYDLDGVWVDGDCWAAELDWCDGAKARFTAETGIAEIPMKREDAGWHEWKMLHRRQFEEYLTRWVDALRAAAPGLQITSNWMYSAHAPKPVAANLDYLSGDYSPTLSVDSARLNARYLASTGMPWDLMAWGFNWVEGTGHSLKTPEHLMQEAAIVLMQGGGFQVYNQPERSGYVPPFMIKTLGQVAEFCRARQEISFRSTSVPQVALLLSTESQFDRSDKVFAPHGCFEEIEGALHALLELHYSVDVLAEHQLLPAMADFPLIVVPDSHRLYGAFVEALVGYVRGGGALLLLGEKCARLFGGHLGVTFDGEPAEGPVELLSGDGFVSVMGPWQEVTPTAAEVRGMRCPTRDTRKGGQCAATVNTVGAGKIAAVYGPIALTHARTHHPHVRQFVGTLVAELFPNPAVCVAGPPCIDVAVRRTADGRLSVHLANLSSLPLGSRTVTDCVTPLTDVRVTITCPERPGRVILMPSGADLAFDYGGGAAVTAVPEVGLHEVLVIE